MKKYLFLTSDLYHIGGMELYLYGKSVFLEKSGWQTFVVYSRTSGGKCEIPGLQRYAAGGIAETGLPPYCWNYKQIDAVTNRIADLVGDTSDGLIVESHTSATSLWGDIVAKRLGGKHFCFLCNETFKGAGKDYGKYLDFYDFKHKRKELLGINKESLRLLFDGYKTVPENECYSFFGVPADPVEDVPFDDSRIPAADLTICYLGRTAKDYFPDVCKGVSEYAAGNADKKICFVIVGDVSGRKDVIESAFNGLENLTVAPLGNMFPIPKKLFSRIDVAVAGSGSALVAAYEGVPTLVADATTRKSNGLLGYDTADYLYADKGAVVTDFRAALARTVDEKPHERLPFILPPKTGPDKYYKEQLDFVESNSSDTEYYPLEKLSKNKCDFRRVLKLKLIKIKKALFRI